MRPRNGCRGRDLPGNKPVLSRGVDYAKVAGASTSSPGCAGGSGTARPVCREARQRKRAASMDASEWAKDGPRWGVGGSVLAPPRDPPAGAGTPCGGRQPPTPPPPAAARTWKGGANANEVRRPRRRPRPACWLCRTPARPRISARTITRIMYCWPRTHMFRTRPAGCITRRRDPPGQAPDETCSRTRAAQPRRRGTRFSPRSRELLAKCLAGWAACLQAAGRVRSVWRGQRYINLVIGCAGGGGRACGTTSSAGRGRRRGRRAVRATRSCHRSPLVWRRRGAAALGGGTAARPADRRRAGGTCERRAGGGVDARGHRGGPGRTWRSGHRPPRRPRSGHGLARAA